MCLFFFIALFNIFSSLLLIAQVHIGPGHKFSNIQEAAPFIKPGDTVYLHTGIYRGYNYIWGLKGRANSWITIRPFGEEQPIIRGQWQFSALEFVRFENLTFQGDKTDTIGPFLNIDNGGNCENQSRYIIISNCFFGGNRSGNTLKFGGVDNFEIVNCTFKEQGDGNAGLALNVCHNGLVRNNIFENIKGRAIQTKLGTRNVKIERNLFLNCGTLDAVLRIGEAGDTKFHCPEDKWTAREIFVHSNIIVGGRSAFSFGQAQNCEIVNNTIINPQQFVFRVLAEQPTFVCDSNRIINNIFYLVNTRYFNGSPNPKLNNVDYSSFVVSNNLFYYTADPNWLPNPTGGPYDAEELEGIKISNSIRGDPLFYDINSFNFRLLPGSPAIGAGVIVPAPKYDYFGNPFKQPPSVGAIEDTTIATIVDESKSKNELLLYLNSKQLYLDGIINEATISIWSICGKRCFPQIDYFSNGTARIDFESLASGIYFLCINEKNSIQTFKVAVKEK
ncbi:MAG: right-handed parallel beta-helix repeat-containing protein [Ignavibacteria bacterium]|nr:right-handed parallel beta-helix repeat-containing protein [Ignavibacteria bacterium]